MTEASVKDVLIIGAGPAGLSTALQLKRYGVEFYLLEKGELGGLLRNANLVENYLGFPEGISGPALVQLFCQQAQQIGVAPIQTEVLSLEERDGCFTAHTNQGSYRAPVAVIASGTVPRRLPGAPANSARVLSEIYPVKNVTGQRFAIVGGGDLAFDFALNLRRNNQVIILNRGEERRCLPLLWERSQAPVPVDYRASTEILEMEEGPQGLTLQCQGPQGTYLLDVDYVVAAIGRESATSMLAMDLINKAPRLEQCGRLYWAGDVKNGIYRQAAIAAGDGIHTAMKIYRFLKGY